VRVLLSVIGSRGDVQPLVALAAHLKVMGHEVRMCTTPDFRRWLEGRGIPVVPVGSVVRWAGSGPSPEQRRRMVRDTVAAQFATIPDAARDCDVLLAFGAMQIAARSVAEALGIRYVYGTYSPTTLPSEYHAPVPLRGWPQDESDDNRRRWAADARRWDDVCGGAVNSYRAAAGLAPVDDVRDHMITEQPWLAADPTLGPWPEPADLSVVQTGAWIERDERPLAAEVQAFLAAGEAPVYFGLGSTRLPSADFATVAVDAARALGRRVILSRGSADLSPPDDGPDCIMIGEANLQALFRKVAAVVHHGGAGTTTICAQAGIPQVVIPQLYDQFYWAQRVELLGIGVVHRAGPPTGDSLVAALTHALAPAVAARAHAVAGQVRNDGAQIAAQRLASPNPSTLPR
jgi:vancomycin aglycone glucosyltransferase